MDVTFATGGGREFTAEVWYFATVRRIKETVRAREGIPVASQRLFLPGRESDGDELDDARDTEHYGILQGSRLILVLVPDADPPPPPPPSQSRSSSPAAAAAAADDDDAPSADPPAAMGVTRAVVRPPPPPPQNPTTAAAAGTGTGGGGGDGNQQQQQQQQERMEVRVVFGETAVAMEVGAMDVVRDLRKEVAERLRLPLPVRDGGSNAAGGYLFVYKQNVMDEDRTLRWHEVKNGDTIEIFNGTGTGGGGA